MMTPWYLGNSQEFILGRHWLSGGFVWFIPVALWSVLWTALTLWHAARRGEKWWFIFFLFVHTAGILEILYLLFVVNAFSKKQAPKRSSKRK